VVADCSITDGHARVVPAANGRLLRVSPAGGGGTCCAMTPMLALALLALGTGIGIVGLIVIIVIVIVLVRVL